MSATHWIHQQRCHNEYSDPHLVTVHHTESMEKESSRKQLLNLKLLIVAYRNCSFASCALFKSHTVSELQVHRKVNTSFRHPLGKGSPDGSPQAKNMVRHVSSMLSLSGACVYRTSTPPASGERKEID